MERLSRLQRLSDKNCESCTCRGGQKSQRSRFSVSWRWNGLQLDPCGNKSFTPASFPFLQTAVLPFSIHSPDSLTLSLLHSPDLHYLLTCLHLSTSALWYVPFYFSICNTHHESQQHAHLYLLVYLSAPFSCPIHIYLWALITSVRIVCPCQQSLYIFTSS